MTLNVSLLNSMRALWIAYICILLCVSENYEIDADGNIVSGYSTPLHDKGLVVEQIVNHSTIINNHNVTNFLDPRRHFTNKIALAFVTPWNTHGYEWSAMYARKFTHISPVYFDIQPIPSSSLPGYMLLGDNHVNTEWLRKVRQKNDNLHIVPRYALTAEHWSKDEIVLFLKSRKLQKEFGTTLAKSLSHNSRGFHGCVLEITPFFNHVAQLQQQFEANEIDKRAHRKLVKQFYKWIEGLAKRLKRSKKYIFLVMSPAHTELVNFKVLFKNVRAIVLMTYDYSVHRGQQGAIAPIQWQQEILSSLQQGIKQYNQQKFLLGLNFYGYKYDEQGRHVMIGDELLELLKKEGDHYAWKWDEKSMEHYLVHADDDQIKIYYPTLKSLAARIEMASLNNAGISIWDLGQGLEYFTDLL